MAVVLALAAAAAYGAGDFLGGLGAKRSPLVAVVVVSQVCSLALLAVVMVATAEPYPGQRDLVVGAAVGTVGCVGVSLLYRGLALGRMSVVAPTTAVGAATIPVAWGLASGERPSPLSLSGVVVAVVAVALISRTPTDHAMVKRASGELAIAVGAGLCFGAVFILLAETSDDAGFWPLLAARPVSVALLTVAALATGRALVPRRADLPVVAVAGLLDMAANIFYLAAIRTGLLSLVAVLGSLYPAGTVLLARVFLRERLGRGQMAGLGLAVAGVALIAGG